MIWLPREDGPTVHPSKAYCLGDTPIAAGLPYGDVFDQAPRAVNWVGADAGDRLCWRQHWSSASSGAARAERDPALISSKLPNCCAGGRPTASKLVSKVFSLAEAYAAMDAVLSRQYSGKIVLET